MLRKTLSAAVLLAIASAAQADPPKSDNGLVCRYEQETGSHIKRRTCETHGQVEERAKNDKDMVKRAANSQDTRAIGTRMSKNPG